MESAQVAYAVGKEEGTNERQRAKLPPSNAAQMFWAFLVTVAKCDLVVLGDDRQKLQRGGAVICWLGSGFALQNCTNARLGNADLALCQSEGCCGGDYGGECSWARSRSSQRASRTHNTQLESRVDSGDGGGGRTAALPLPPSRSLVWFSRPSSRWRQWCVATAAAAAAAGPTLSMVYKRRHVTRREWFNSTHRLR